MAYNPYYQGNPTYIPSGTTDINGVPQVSSVDEVKAATVPYGVSVFFVRGDSDLFYAKNSLGEIKCFKYQEIPIPSNDPENFVTRAEFDALRKQYEQLSQQHAAIQQPVVIQPVQPNGDHEGHAVVSGDPGAGQGAILQSSGEDGFNPIAAQPSA